MRARTRLLGFVGALAAAVALAGPAAAAAGDPARTPNAWGGRYTTSTGENVRVIASDQLPVDENLTRGWAEYLASLPHGSELERLTLQIAPYSEVQAVCGFGSLACYSPSRELIIAPHADLPSPGTPTARSIIAHEYGHHIARHRVNPPWSAISYGTKRWASRMSVCERTAAGMLFPGGDGLQYRLDPGEGFAEAYRVLAEIRTGQPESPWQVVDARLRPDALALQALEQDVLNPWTGPSTDARAGSFTRRGKPLRSFPVATPHDGSLAIRVAAPTKLRLRLSLYDRSRRVTIATGGRALRTTICGHRSLAIRVTRQSGVGRFSLSITRP
jgi:hypothetical protein